MINFIIIHDPFLIRTLDEKVINFIKSKGNLYDYYFKFKLYNNNEISNQQMYNIANPNFELKDINFKQVTNNIFKQFKHLSNIFIITIEHASPFGLYFVDKLNKKYPNKCIGIIAYPFRLYNKESLERRVWKFKENKGWNKYISKKYDVDDYMININNNRFQDILNNIKTKNEYENESRHILMMIIDYRIRRQYDKIPILFNIPTLLFTRLDMDVESIIKLNFDRKEIADMKKIVNEYDTLYNSMMWNFDRIKYDKNLIEINKINNNLKIQYIIGGINDVEKLEIIDGIKILI